MENVKQILFVNACMWGPERSRTWKLCQTFLNACKTAGRRRRSGSGT